MQPVDYKERYKTSLVLALAGFQMIEESLKTYLSFYHDAVRGLLPPGFTYTYSRADVEEAALGKLLMIFSKTTSNASLVLALRKLQKDRDLIAHRALLDLFRADPSSQNLKSEARRMMDLAARVNAHLGEINEECLTILAAKQIALSPRK